MRAMKLVGALVLSAAGCASAPRAAEVAAGAADDAVRAGPGSDAAPFTEALPAPARASELERALGLFPRNAGPFDAFARPVTNLDFHHPFIWNEVRPVYAYHWLPDAGLLDGGSIKVYACQVNLALTDRLGFTAYKDGYVHFDSNALPGDRGMADLAGGLKYKVFECEDCRAIATVGLAFEDYHVGDDEVLEGEGHGVFDLFGSAAREYGGIHFIATAGVLLPRRAAEDNRAVHWHLHADVPAAPGLSALFEVNGMHHLESARRNAGLGVPLGIEGFDYTNLGSEGVDHNDVITAALGLRIALADDLSLGAAFERPITHRKDVFQQRVTIDLTYRF